MRRAVSRTPCRLYGIRCRRSRPTALDACASLFPFARVRSIGKSVMSFRLLPVIDDAKIEKKNRTFPSSVRETDNADGLSALKTLSRLVNIEE